MEYQQLIQLKTSQGFYLFRQVRMEKWNASQLLFGHPITFFLYLREDQLSEKLLCTQIRHQIFVQVSLEGRQL